MPVDEIHIIRPIANEVVVAAAPAQAEYIELIRPSVPQVITVPCAVGPPGPPGPPASAEQLPERDTYPESTVRQRLELLQDRKTEKTHTAAEITRLDNQIDELDEIIDLVELFDNKLI